MNENYTDLTKIAKDKNLDALQKFISEQVDNNWLHEIHQNEEKVILGNVVNIFVEWNFYDGLEFILNKFSGVNVNIVNEDETFGHDPLHESISPNGMVNFKTASILIDNNADVNRGIWHPRSGVLLMPLNIMLETYFTSEEIHKQSPEQVEKVIEKTFKKGANLLFGESILSKLVYQFGSEEYKDKVYKILKLVVDNGIKLQDLLSDFQKIFDENSNKLNSTRKENIKNEINRIKKMLEEFEKRSQKITTIITNDTLFKTEENEKKRDRKDFEENGKNNEENKVKKFKKN